MILVEKVQVMNMENAFRGLRNPMNSWAKSDSEFGLGDGATDKEFSDFCEVANTFAEDTGEDVTNNNGLHLDFNSCGDLFEYAFLGAKDLDLARRMIKAGNSDSKFLRQILVSMDITAPLYWWKECDQYKVGTVTNSCSTMHKLTSRALTISDFSFDGKLEKPEQRYVTDIYTILDICEYNRLKFLETGDKGYWRRLIQMLPEAYNQKRTWTANYQVLRAIYFDRRYHKLQEWQDFCARIEKMPYAAQLICYDPKQEETHE